VLSHRLCLLSRDAQWWVVPALCEPPLSWVEGYLVSRNTAADPLPDTPTGHTSKVPTAAVIPHLLPTEAAALQRQHPRRTFLMSLPAALRNLRKSPGVKAQWKAVADGVFVSRDTLEAYVHDLGGGAPGPGAGAPAAHDHVRYMRYGWSAMGASGRPRVVVHAGAQIQTREETARWSQHFGRRILFPQLTLAAQPHPLSSPLPPLPRWPTRMSRTSC